MGRSRCVREICSSYPTAGGLYYWSAKLARTKGPKWAWFTGWFNLLGQIGIFFVVLLVLPDNNVGLSHVFDQAPPTISSSGLTGWTGGTFIAIYLFAMGLLLAQYTITGFDASAHVSEETVGANVSAPKAIVRAIYVSAIAALLLNVALTSALPKAADGGIDAEQYGAIAFGGPGDSFLVNAAPRLLDTALGSAAAKLLMFIAIVAQFWPFWPPFGETTFGTGADAVTVFHQNNFNFTGPLILATAAFFWLYWGLSARRWFTGPKVQGTREEQLAIERELEAAAAGKAAVPTPGGASCPSRPDAARPLSDQADRVSSGSGSSGSAGP